MRVEEGGVVQLEKMLHTPALPQGAVEAQVVYLPDIYTKVVDLRTYIKQARRTIREHVQQHAAALKKIDPDADAVTIYPTFKCVALLMRRRCAWLRCT